MLEWLLCAASLAGTAAPQTPPPSAELLEFIGDWDEREAALLDRAEIAAPSIRPPPAALARPEEPDDGTPRLPAPSLESTR